MSSYTARYDEPRQMTVQNHTIYFGSWVSTDFGYNHLHNRVTCKGLTEREEGKLKDVVSDFISHPSFRELLSIDGSLPYTVAAFHNQTERRREVLGRLLRDTGVLSTCRVVPVQSEGDCLELIKPDA